MIHKIIIALILTVNLCAVEKPKITFSTTPNSGFYLSMPDKVSYERCSVCGRDVPSQMGWYLVVWLDGDSPYIKASRKAAFPYRGGRYFICTRCILEKLGVKPDWQMPDGR
jgi:hypothetical protein